MNSSVRTHGRSATRVACLVAALAAALLLAACSGQSSPVPPAANPPVPSSKVGQTTATVSTPTPSSTHQGTVDPDVYTAIVASLKSRGFTFKDETGLLMRYGNDKEHVTVSGTMSQRGTQRSIVEVQLENGTWKVISAK